MKSMLMLPFILEMYVKFQVQDSSEESLAAVAGMFSSKAKGM